MRSHATTTRATRRRVRAAATTTADEQQQQQQQPFPLLALPDDLLGQALTATSGHGDTTGAFNRDLRLVGKLLRLAHDQSVMELTLHGFCLNSLRSAHGRLTRATDKTFGPLTALVKRHTSLTSLSLHRMTAREVATVAVAAAPSLRLLTMKSCDQEGLGSLVACPGLQHLTLHLESLPRLTPIMTGVSVLTNLRNLSITAGDHWLLARMAMGEAPCDLLAAALRPLVHLQRLDLAPSCGNTLGMHSEIPTRFLSVVTALQELRLHGFAEPHAADIAELTGLKSLEVASGTWAGGLEPLSVLTALTRLRLKVKEGPPGDGFGALGSLCHLSEFEPGRIIGLGRGSALPFPHLTALQSLRWSASGVTGSFEVQAIGQLTQLRQVRLDHCDELAPLHAMQQLRELTLRGFGCNVDFQPLEHLVQLERLQLQALADADALPSLAFLRQLARLQRLEVKGQGLDVAHLRELTWLRELDISTSQDLVDLTFLARLSSLRQLSLRGCRATESLAGLEQLTQLEQLALCGFRKLRSFEHLRPLTRLQRLELTCCDALTDVHPLSGLTQLTELAIHSCWQVSSLLPLEGLTRLTKLTASGRPELRSLQGLQQMRVLRRLDVSGCITLQHLHRLWYLVVSGCRKIPEAQLRALTQVRELYTKEW